MRKLRNRAKGGGVIAVARFESVRGSVESFVLLEAPLCFTACKGPETPIVNTVFAVANACVCLYCI